MNEEASLLVDWVAVEADIDHSHAGDLQITLTSPFGTESVLHTAHMEGEDTGQVRRVDERERG